MVANAKVQSIVVKGDELGMVKTKGQSNYICEEADSWWPRPRDKIIRLRDRVQGCQGEGTKVLKRQSSQGGQGQGTE